MQPIRVGDSGRYFVQGDGVPFFWLGDTQWELFRLFTQEDARTVIRRRKEQGFTVLQVMLTGVGDGSGPNLDGEKPWIGDDPSAPNETYFRVVDAAIQAALRDEMILVVGIFHQLQVARITPHNARAYARRVSARYRNVPNLVWCMYPQARAEFVPVCRELAAGLQEADGGGHLISAHPDPSPTSSSFMHDERWLAFNMIQTCMSLDRIVPMVRSDHERLPVKPVVMAEGAYEGEEFGRLQTALDIRRQAYWSQLAGGCHTYGHNDAWAAPERWRAWIDSEGAAHLAVFRRIVTACPAWWKTIPDPLLFEAGEGAAESANVAARSADGDWALVYLSRSEPIHVRMERAATGRPVDAVWIDPTNGEETVIGRFDGKGVREFAPPDGWQDSVLKLTAVR